MRTSFVGFVAVAALLPVDAWGQAGLPRGGALQMGGRAVTVDPRALEKAMRNPNSILVHTPGLKIVESGHAEDNGDGTRTLTFAACAVNGDDSALPVTAMHYALATPGKALSGDMGPYFEPQQKLSIYNNHPQPPTVKTGCRRVKLTLPACAVPPGEYDLTLTAETAAGAGLSVKDKSSIPPNLSSVAITSTDGFQVATPHTVSGTATGSCGVKPKEIRLYADKGAAAVIAPVDAGGNWSAPFRFRQAGSDTLHAKVEPYDKIDDSYASLGVSVAPTPIEVTVSQVPASMRLNTVAAAVAQVRNRDTKAPLADFPLSMALGKAPACVAVTDATGTVHCSLPLTAASGAIGNQAPVVVASTGADAISSTGTTKTLVTSVEGLIFHSVPADLMAGVLADQQPYGVLLNNYNPKWSGTGAHLDNGALFYPTGKTTPAEPFDIPTYHVSDDIVFYLDGVMVRLKPFTVKAPARLDAAFYLTPGPNGRGPAIKGFCFDWSCWAIGYDDFIPDITNIKVKDGGLAIDFAVVDGKVRPTLAKADVTLDFTCGGISALACGAIKSAANDKIREKLKNPPMIGTMLQRVGANMDKAIAGFLPTWKIKTLTSIAFDDAGGMTVAGTPLTP